MKSKIYHLKNVSQLFNIKKNINNNDNNGHSNVIIGWVPGCDTLHQLIKEKREISNTIPNIEHRKMFKLSSKYETCNFLYKVEIFKESIKDLPGLELNNII